MADTDVSTLTLVPPTRLGDLLTDARTAKGRSIDEVARSSAGRFSRSALHQIEAGRCTLDDAELADLAALYDVETGELLPVRSGLVIDLDRGTIAAGVGEERAVDASSVDDVLVRYLSLVTTLRSLPAGTPVPLRELDLEVLAEALSMERTAVERRLEALMADGDGRVAEAARRLRRRRVVPAAGILVAATAVGVLLFARADDQPAAKSVSNGGGATGVVAEPAPSTGLIEPLVVEAGADGATTGLIPPATVERDG